MEDAWIDNNAGGLPSANASTEDDLNGMSNVLDVMIRAMLIGFFLSAGEPCVAASLKCMEREVAGFCGLWSCVEFNGWNRHEPFHHKPLKA